MKGGNLEVLEWLREQDPRCRRGKKLRVPVSRRLRGGNLEGRGRGSKTLLALGTSVHSCPEAESRESPRERERKIQEQKKRERQSKMMMKRGTRDNA